MVKKWFSDDLSEQEIIDLGLYKPGELFSSSYLVYRDLLREKLKNNDPVLRHFSISFPDNQRLVTVPNGIFVGDTKLRKIKADTEMTHFESDVIVTITSKATNPFICKVQLDLAYYKVWNIIKGPTRHNEQGDYGTPVIKSSEYVHTIRGMSAGAKIFRDNIRARQCTFTFREFSDNKTITENDIFVNLWEDSVYVK